MARRSRGAGVTRVKPAEAERFAANPPESVRAVLCHGTDKGSIRERAQSLARAFLGERIEDPFASIVLFVDEMETQDRNIAEKLRSPFLFGGRRCVRLRLGSRDAAGLLTACAGNVPADVLLIVEAPALKTSSTVWKLFERREDWAVIACYPDDRRDLEKLIDASVHAAGMSIDAEARLALLDYLGGDRLASRMEIDKTLLYAHGRARVSLEDVLAVAGDVSALEIDGAIDAAALGKTAAFDRAIHRILVSGVSPARIVTAAIRHFCLLHMLRCAADAGQDPRAALEKRRPVVFFKRREAVLLQCARWSRSGLDRALEGLRQGERLSRIGGALAQSGVVRVLTIIAAMAARRSEKEKRAKGRDVP